MVVFFHPRSTKEDEFSVSIQPAVGELLLPVTMSEPDFTKEQSNANTPKHLDNTEQYKRSTNLALTTKDFFYFMIALNIKFSSAIAYKIVLIK